LALWILKILAKTVVFVVSSGKKQITTFGPPIKILGKSPCGLPLEKILQTPMISSVYVALQFNRIFSIIVINED